jgi:hypothetical protein
MGLLNVEDPIYCLDSELTDDGKVASLTTDRALLPRNIIFLLLILISLSGRVNPRALCGWKY